jgi:hypothetical protein
MTEKMAFPKERVTQDCILSLCRSCAYLCWYTGKKTGTYKCAKTNARKNPDQTACSLYEGRSVGLVWRLNGVEKDD